MAKLNLDIMFFIIYLRYRYKDIEYIKKMEGYVFNMKKSFKLLAAFTGMGIPAYFFIRLQQGCIDQWKEVADKNQELFLVMDQWLRIKQEGKNLEQYFIKNHYQTIAIYGMGHLGQHLARELRDTEVEIAYGIDSNCGHICSDITKMTVDDDLPEVDVVVVNALGEFDAAYEVLSAKLGCPIVAIEDILNEI